MEPAIQSTRTPSPDADGTSGRMVGIPIAPGEDRVMSAIRDDDPQAASPVTRSTMRGMTGDIETFPETAPAVAGASAAVALLIPPMAIRRRSRADSSGSATAAVVAPPVDGSSPPVAGERCAEERRIADERCELATRARALADAAADALTLAQRTYDAHEAAAVTASWGADPRAIHDAKDAAQGGFRAAVQAATTPEALEIAARDWLNEINRINTDARDATATASREHAAAAAIGATLERLGLEADAARIGAANADAACLAARVAVADCDEQSVTDAAVARRTAEADEPWTPHLDEDETLGREFEGGLTPRIFRLLRGDRKAMTTVVATLADGDDEARRRWQLQMTGLIEAIVADAIEASALDFPEDHPFWGGFSRIQSREIVHALSSLGFRFDGLGGWTDDRYPSQRDLSLALGYAGLDPMRVRQWPTGDETAELFRDVTVVADEYLAGIAGDLTLAEMVRMLGRRADGLADVWNHWGRIRPLLLEED